MKTSRLIVLAVFLAGPGGPVFRGAQRSPGPPLPGDLERPDRLLATPATSTPSRSPAASPASSRAHEGYEAFARFSPDGKYIAFTGEYDGNREVYLIPAEGGVPKRLTYTPTLAGTTSPTGWGRTTSSWAGPPTASRSSSGRGCASGTISTASSTSSRRRAGPPEQLPLPRGGFCSFSPDGKKLAYNRIFREFRTWKRYRGGMADDIWIYDFATKKTENITNNPALDIIPMWSGDRIYFVSDRDDNKRMNLYVYDLKTKETRKLTNFTDYDIKFPSLGAKPIVFENGGYIYRFDLATEKTDKVPVVIADDVSGRSRLVKVGEPGHQLRDLARRQAGPLRGPRRHLHRPAQYGNTRNLTETPGVHERNSKWSPDGQMDRLHLRPQRRGRDLHHAPGRDGRGRSSSRRTPTPTSTGSSGRPTARRSCGPTRSSSA